MKNLFFFVLFFSVLVGMTKGEGASLAIKLTNPSPVQYCTDPIPIAESLIIEGTFAISGMKISFSEGYKAGEDQLLYSGSVANITGTWYEAQSYLLLKPSGTSTPTTEDYRDAIRSIKYKNSKLIPTLGIRKISITLEDVDYLPETQHFYRYVHNVGISWTKARDEAALTMYQGLLKGYLATISSDIENKFIQSKTQGVGWIGASDAGVEGAWRWVTGPEGLEDNGLGRLFWNGKGVDYRNNVSGTGPYLGRYNNWNTDEPNETGNNEDYAHILFFANNPNASLRWNDLPVGGGQGEYSSMGYLIEFGGMENITLDLSATLTLQVNTMLFTNKGIQPAICEGDSVMLNKVDTTHAVYTWTPPDLSLSSFIISNPTAKPKITSTFFVTGMRGACSDTASYRVPVNPKPVVSLGRDTTICNPANIVLSTHAQFAGYHWFPNAEITQTINVNKDGNYSVIVTDGLGCKASAEIKVSFTDKPKVDFSGLNRLICGRKSDILDVTTDKGDFTVERMSDGVIINNLSVSVPGFGQYDLKIKATDSFSCYSDSVVKIGFYKTPAVRFDFDSTTCKGYNLPARYQGDADTIVSNFKWVFGGEILADTIGRNFLVVPLGINRSQRDLQLVVTQDGCSNTFIQRNIRVIPKLDLQIVDSLGCEPFNAEFKAINTEVVKYFWDFGDKSPVIEGASVTPHIYQNAAYYDVKLKVTTIVSSGQGCTNEVKIDRMVHVAPVPDVAFSLSPLTCLDPGINTITYAGLVGTANDRYIWDLTNLSKSEIVTDPGEHQGPWNFDLKTKPQATIGLQVISEFGCESANEYITLNRKPDFSINASAFAACTPFEPTLSGLINVDDLTDKVDYTWDFGDGTTGTGSSVPHTYNDPGKSYTIILSGKSSLTQCTNEVTENSLLKTYPKPKADFIMDHPVVYNDQPEVKFIDQSVGNPSAWLWEFGDGVTAEVQNPIYNFVKMGHQRVMLEVTNDELCTDTISHDVLVAFDRLFPPNGFSPNASNVDDRIFLLNSEGIVPEGYHFTILSRWNDLIFEAKDEIKGWDGRMINGSLAPLGVYVWRLDFTDFLGRRHRQTGAVTLVY